MLWDVERALPIASLSCPKLSKYCNTTCSFCCMVGPARYVDDNILNHGSGWLVLYKSILREVDFVIASWGH